MLLFSAVYASFLSEKPAQQTLAFLPKEPFTLKAIGFVFFALGFFLVLLLFTLPVDLLAKIPIIGIPFGIAGTGLKIALLVLSIILALIASLTAAVLL